MSRPFGTVRRLRDYAKWASHEAGEGTARASAVPTTLGEWSPPYTAATGQRRSPS